MNNSKSIDCIRSPKLSFKEALELKYEGIDAHHKEIGLFTTQPFFKNVLKSPKNLSKTDKKITSYATSVKESQKAESKTIFQWEEKQQISISEELKESQNSNNKDFIELQ